MICERNYTTEYVLYDALSTCAEDTKCKMIKGSSNKEEGPFTLCQNASDIGDVVVENFTSFQKERNRKYYLNEVT